MLSKSELFKIKLKQKKVILETGELLIREFTTSDRETFELLAMKMSKGGDAKNMKAKLISLSVINQDGGRYFGDDEVGAISQLPSTVTETLFNEILALNAMTDNAVEVAEGN